MAKVFDRIKETSTSIGSGDFTLEGSPTGYRTFDSVFSVGDQTFYCIIAGTGEFEVGQGTYSATNTLERTNVLSSTSSGNLVNFIAGSKDVFVTMPASKAASSDDAIAYAIALG